MTGQQMQMYMNQTSNQNQCTVTSTQSQRLGPLYCLAHTPGDSHIVCTWLQRSTTVGCWADEEEGNQLVVVKLEVEVVGPPGGALSGGTFKQGLEAAAAAPGLTEEHEPASSSRRKVVVELLYS